MAVQGMERQGQAESPCGSGGAHLFCVAGEQKEARSLSLDLGQGEQDLRETIQSRDLFGQGPGPGATAGHAVRVNRHLCVEILPRVGHRDSDSLD